MYPFCNGVKDGPPGGGGAEEVAGPPDGDYESVGVTHWTPGP